MGCYVYICVVYVPAAPKGTLLGYTARERTHMPYLAGSPRNQTEMRTKRPAPFLVFAIHTIHT